ncbi:hypothetical protein [Aeribacillus alveayuensis]|uniref:Transposase n=1 Tax=Aeribacillus alveayuensis TaxID=279215 RepID=A0ABT9VSP3_9BACI|nr:hypothetical protein [Bacillus alveayuensis]
MNRLAHHHGIHKFFTMLGLALYFSKPVMKHLVHIVDAMVTKGFSGTLTDLHHGSFHPNHRTTLSHFFTKSPWEEETLLRKLQQWILRRVERRGRRAVKRYWILVQLTYVYSMFESNSDFSYGLDLLRKRKGHSLVEFIYRAAKQNIPIDTVKKQLHVA